MRGAVGIAGFNWATMQGGDGFVALQDPDRLPHRLQRVAGRQHGPDRSCHRRDDVDPSAAEAGEPALRWNWDTPLVLSPHDPKVIYAAANKVFRSSNRGLNWETAGTDLTSDANREEIVTMGVKGSDIRISKDDGIQAWPTIISFAESPSAPASSMPAPTTVTCRCRATADARGPTSLENSRTAEGHLGV